jgi:hypothetical protein
MEQETLVYLYGIVPADADAPPPELVGVEGAAVRLLRLAGIAGVVSDVPADSYADEALDSRLEDLAWVGERGLAHERVLDWFADRGAVLPSALLSLHRDDERLRARLEEDEARLASQVEALRGRREWGVKLWRHDALLAERLAGLSPALQALDAEMETAPPGRAFLLGKKRDTLRTEELKRLSVRVVHAVFDSLRERAERSTQVPLPPAPARGERALVLHAAFLVTEEGFAAFQRRLGELAGEFQPFGFEFEFTGPWPPYHFAQPDAA